VVYWCNSYTIVHFSLDIIEWFKYKLEKFFKIVLDTDSPPSQYQQRIARGHYPGIVTSGDSVTHKHFTEMRRLAHDETPFLLVMPPRATTLV
jgi:hypothetical protein